MRRGALIIVALLAVRSDAADRANVVVTGGQGSNGWHGSADVQSVGFEWGKALSPRLEVFGVAGVHSVRQPKSWFGDQYGDGQQTVFAGSLSLLWRLRLARMGSVEPFAEISTGPMWAESQVPAATSRFNFITQYGYGAMLFADRRHPLLIAYRFSHISNGGYSPRNPGWNVHSVLLGTRLRRVAR